MKGHLVQAVAEVPAVQEVLRLLNDEDARVAAAVRDALPALAEAVERLKKTGW